MLILVFLRNVAPWQVAKNVVILSAIVLSVRVLFSVAAWWPILTGWWPILTGYWPFPRFVWWLLSGFLLILIGSILSLVPEGWFKERRWWSLYLVFRAVAFAVMVSVGGLLTTLGWSGLDNYLDDRACLRAAATEWVLNDLSLKAIGKERDTVTAEEYRTAGGFMRVSTGEIRRVLERADLVRSPHDPGNLTVYVLQAERLNQDLDNLQNVLFDPLTGPDLRKAVMEGLFGKNGTYDKFLMRHHLVKGILNRPPDYAILEVKRHGVTALLKITVQPVKNDIYKPPVGPRP
jgi:hypothetical protein